jgi:hypothetical protein
VRVFDNYADVLSQGMPHNFKVGDVVECIADCFTAKDEKIASKGERRTITSVTKAMFNYFENDDPKADVVWMLATNHWKLAG